MAWRSGLSRYDSVEDRLMRQVKVDIVSGCHVWCGSNRLGYGVIMVDKKSVFAHRLIYELMVGKIPDGYAIHHKCNNHSCVNPDHLEALDPSRHVSLGRDNVMVKNMNKKYCVNGHLFDDANTRIDVKGARVCKRCDCDRSLKYSRKRKHLGDIPLVKVVKTHCYRGHVFDEKNTRIDTRGVRVCRKCKSENAMRNYYRYKQLSQQPFQGGLS